ncbi:MAG: MoaD/ThiS family protein [Burkholderiales bacterium]
MRVVIPSPLFSYTSGQREVDGTGDTLARLLAHLDGRYPGIRHRMIDEQDRIRPHIRVFVNAQMATGLDFALAPDDEVLIVAALSGG